MKSNFKAVDWFVTTIKAGSSIAATGSTGSFNVTSKSVNGETLADGDYFFYVTIKGEDSTQREIFRIWRVAGDLLYFDRRKSPSGMFLHAAGESVQVNDVAEAMNLAFETIDDFGKVEDDGGVTVKVLGGKVQVGTTNYAVSTVSLTLADNSVLSVVFDTADQTFKSTGTVADTHIVMATVTTSGGDIASLGDMRPYNYVPLSQVPGSSVATVSYGLAKSDGTLVTYARADHTHGTPALPSASQLNATMDGTIRGIKDGAWVAIPGAGSEATTPAPSGSVASDETTFWRLTYSGGNYDDFKTDGIYHYDATGNLIAIDSKTGTYSAGGMIYSDGTELGSDGSVSGSSANYAYVDQPNVFTQTNQFEANTLFKSAVYGELLITTATVDFSLGNTQKISISGATAFSLTNLAPGTHFALFVVNSGGGSISGITATKTGGDSLQVHCPSGTIPDVTASGGYLLGIYCAETAAHVFANVDPTSSI